MNNRDKLIEFLADNNLERREIADLLKVKIAQVDRWLAPFDSSHYEDVPDMAIELLEIKLSAKKD